jgi:hypothetical protein
MAIPLSPSSGLRAAGMTAALLLPSSTPRRTCPKAVLLGLSDVGARRLGPVGITLISITPDEGETFSAAKQAACDAVSTVGWVAGALLLSTAVERLPLPRAARALVAGLGLYVADVQLVSVTARLVAKARQARDAAEPPPAG